MFSTKTGKRQKRKKKEKKKEEEKTEISAKSLPFRI